MATNNAIDAPLPLTVPNGGTGRATGTTAYGTICAGTSATSAQQTVSPGTSGQVLTSNGASSLPSYQALPGSTSALTWLGSVSASASATVSFPNLLTATYDNYIVIYENVICSATTQMQAVVGTGATPTYQATNYVSGAAEILFGGLTVPADITTYINITGAAIQVTAAGLSAGGFLMIGNANSTNNQNYYGMESFKAASHPATTLTWGYWAGGVVLTSLQFALSTGTYTTGTFKLYGYQN
jgi:hypothetical protein